MQWNSFQRSECPNDISIITTTNQKLIRINIRFDCIGWFDNCRSEGGGREGSCY